jgi:hypothetical protein
LVEPVEILEVLAISSAAWAAWAAAEQAVAWPVLRADLVVAAAEVVVIFLAVSPV